MSNFKSKNPLARFFICAGLALASINCFGQLEQSPIPPPPGTPPPAPLADACPNIPGNQPVYPQGYTIDSLGNCVLIQQPATPQPAVTPAVGQPAPIVVPAPAPPPAAGQPPAAPGVTVTVPTAPAPPQGPPNTVVTVPPPPPPAAAGQVPPAATETQPTSGNWFTKWFWGYYGWAKEHYVRAGLYLALIILVLLALLFRRRVIAFVRSHRGGVDHHQVTRAIAMILVPATALTFMLFSEVPAHAATLNQDALTAGVPGNNYDVTFNGTGFASASGAYFWCPGVSTTFMSVTDTQLKLRVTVSASAPTGQICGLRVMGINPPQGYQDFGNRLTIGTKEQYGAAQMVPFVQHYAPLVPPAPPAAPPIDKAARKAAQNAQADNNRLRAEFRSEVDQLKATVAALRAAPAPAPAPAPVPPAPPAATTAPVLAASASSTQALADRLGKMDAENRSWHNEVSKALADIRDNVETLHGDQVRQAAGQRVLVGYTAEAIRSKDKRAAMIAAYEEATGASVQKPAKKK